MVSISVKPAQTSPTPTTPATPPKVDWLEFVGHLARKHALSGDLVHKLADHHKKQKKLRELWELTDLSASDFADETASFYELARLDLPQLLGATSFVGRISPRFLRETSVFPCQLADGQTILVVADPSDETAIHAAELALGCPITIAVASFEDIATVLSERLADDTPAAIDVGETLQHHREADVESLRDLASGAPVVRAVNDLLEKALELRATDIHIEPFRTGLAVRMRVDGLLRPLPAPSDVLPQALVSRIKILAGLNIAERRLPQDGAAHLRVSRSDVDIRVATMPTQHGESAAIRLLAKDRGVLEIPKLGFSTTDQEKLRRLLQLPHGIVVVTGPTGSGKTTTLATMLTALNDTTRKILTIEDPVEYEIRGINQSQVKPEIGLSFAAALRAFVRQDPDVIMVGEVRDQETAHIAIHAALTGHLVLTTLHTESAAAAIPRLVDLGVEAFFLQSTLRAVIAQRLVRILCERCKVQRQLTDAALETDPRHLLLGLNAGDCVSEPVGCERCGGTGFRGRTGLFEVLEVNDEVRGLVGKRSDAGTIAAAARSAGMTTMFEQGVLKCRAGITSAGEVLRVTTAS